MSFLDLHKDYRIIVIQEIGNDMCAIVLEHLETRQVRFLRVQYEEIDSHNDKINIEGTTRKLNIV